MAKIGILYDYIFMNNQAAPEKMVVQFKEGEINWNRNFMYIPIQLPFRSIDKYDFHPTMLGISIFLEDLTVNQSWPQHIGINLKQVGNRARYEYGVRELVGSFYIQMSDIEDVLHMDLHQHYNWR